MVSGFVNNESESLISYSLTRKAGEAKDTYAITPSGAESQDNYSVTYESGALAINATEINPDTPDPNDPTNPDAKRFTISNPADVVCNGLSQKDEVTVHDAATGKDLELGTDYTLSYSEDTTNVGTVTVTVNGTGNYSGTVAQTYQITPATLTVTTPSDPVCSAEPKSPLPRLSSSRRSSCRRQHIERIMFGLSSELMKFWKYGSP